MRKFDKFKSELENLCLKHEIQIATSSYDNIEIWDLKKDDKECVFYCHIEDKTEESPE